MALESIKDSKPSIMEGKPTTRSETECSRRWHGNEKGGSRLLLAGMAVLAAWMILKSVNVPMDIHRNAYGTTLGWLRNGDEELTRRENDRISSSSSSARVAPSYEPRCDTKKEISETMKQPIHHTTYDADPYEAPEPFQYLHDCCEDCNPPVPESPDPLVSVTWVLAGPGTTTPLQIYRTKDPVRVYTIPADASAMVNSRSTMTNSTPRIIVLENCTVVMDWGSERAAWFEVVMPSYNEETVQVRASVSEYNRPYPGKTRALTRYGNSTYRLETNDELYEGVRFTFLHVTFSPDRAPHHQALEIDDYSLVSKIKPISYTSRFRSSNELLTKAWYWGAYGVRLNMERNQLNSILIERGDRVAIQGDGHPTIATVLSVFYGAETQRLLKNVLNDTDSAHKRVVDDVIMAYPLYWCLSAMDYYWATGGDRSSSSSSEDDDGAFVNQLVADIQVLLDQRIADFLDPHLDITWFGWDDRVGNGWCFHSKDDACTREGLLAFAGLVIRVCHDFSHMLQSLVADPYRTDQERETFQELLGIYRDHSQTMTQALRNVEEFPSGFGVHAAAYAINARVATQDEISDAWMGTTAGTNTLNNAVTICSFSQFNQYWILQAFGNLQGMGLEHALKSIELCWGPMMELSTGGCFWELSSPEWLSFMQEGDQAPHLPSYCHPWASGVTPWLSRLVGGTSPLVPGYAQYLSMPYVSPTHPTVASTTATPRGNIEVTAQLSPPVLGKENRLRYEFRATLTATMDGVFGVPKSILVQPSSEYEFDLESNGEEVFLRRESITVVNPHEGTTVPANRSEAHEIAVMFPGSRMADHPRSQEYVFLVLGRSEYDDDVHGNDGNSYVITAEYETTILTKKSVSLAHGNDAVRGGVTKQLDRSLLAKDVSPFPVPVYPASVEIDAKSQGDGLLVYGMDGYALMGCNVTDACNVTETLPSYVQSIRIRQHGYPGWVIPKEEFVGYSTDDPVYLPFGAKRVLGTVGIDDQGGGDINCILVDVQLTTVTEATAARASQPNKNNTDSYYYLSIYFVASRIGNKHAIRVMDGETYDLIAPTTLMEDYTEGIWWTLKTNRRSVRLKMLDIQGIHLSAVAFATELPTFK